MLASATIVLLEGARRARERPWSRPGPRPSGPRSVVEWHAGIDEQRLQAAILVPAREARRPVDRQHGLLGCDLDARPAGEHGADRHRRVAARGVRRGPPLRETASGRTRSE